MQRARSILPSLQRFATCASAALIDVPPTAAVFQPYKSSLHSILPSSSSHFSTAATEFTSEKQQIKQQGFASGGFSPSDFPPERIRNFSIIAHIDHGKSTLADRLMEMTGAINPGARQYLDKLQVEKERGITVKAQTASLVYRSPSDGQAYLLNLIDTPGHVDFSYEVSRSLAACQGCLLLVDASQGVQAQTVANFFLAFEQDLTIVPVLNKIDMPASEPERVIQQLVEAFSIDPTEVDLHVSAKTGKGLDTVLEAIVHRMPAPKGDTNSSKDAAPRMLLFDAYHDEYRGVVCLVAVVDGSIRRNDKVVSLFTGNEYEVNEVGVLAPEPHATDELLTGQVGYVLTGMKNTSSARVGDTWHLHKRPVAPIAGFKEPKSMVFAGIFPVSASGFDQLQAAMQRLTLNDASVSVKRENSNALGAGFRCGFSGLLHMDVFRQRLEQVGSVFVYICLHS
jgi:elongation factor 4